jgi:hypothetical protein
MPKMPPIHGASNDAPVTNIEGGKKYLKKIKGNNLSGGQAELQHNVLSADNLNMAGQQRY